MNVLKVVSCVVYFSDCSSAAQGRQGVGKVDVERDLDC